MIDIPKFHSIELYKINKKLLYSWHSFFRPEKILVLMGTKYILKHSGGWLRKEESNSNSVNIDHYNYILNNFLGMVNNSFIRVEGFYFQWYIKGINNNDHFLEYGGKHNTQSVSC